MPEEVKAPPGLPGGDPNPNPNPSPTPTPTPAPAGGAPAFTMPTELAGKKPEEVARYYSDRYKDYDDVKTRAETWKDFKEKPEDVRNNLETWNRVTAALRQGKQIRVENGQIMAVDPATAKPGATAPAKDPAATGDPEDWLNGYEMLEPKDQARRQSGFVLRTANEVIAAKEKEFRDATGAFQAQIYRQIDGVLNMIATIQEHPELKIKDILTRGAEIAQKNPGVDPIAGAIEALLQPALIESRATEMAARKLADERAKAERDRAAGAIPNGSSGSTFMDHLRAKQGPVTHGDILANLRKENLIQ